MVIRLAVPLVLAFASLSACSKSGPCGEHAEPATKPDDDFARLGGFPPGANACASDSMLRVAYPGDRTNALAKWDAFATSRGWKKTENAAIQRANFEAATRNSSRETILYAKEKQFMVVEVTVSAVDDVVVQPAFVDCTTATSYSDRELCGL
jgi:hypothetical protein